MSPRAWQGIRLVLVAVLAMAAWPAAGSVTGGGDPGPAGADSVAADSTATVAAADSTTASVAADTTGAGGLAGLLNVVTDQPQPALPLVTAWTRLAKGSLKAGAQKVTYGAELSSRITLRDQSGIDLKGTESYDDYRVQKKSVERRSGSLTYRAGGQEALQAQLALTDDWSLDKTINSLGATNANRRENRTATASLRRSQLLWAGIEHDLLLSGSVIDQKGIQLGQRNDHSERELAGAWRAVFSPDDGLKVAAGIYGMTNSGDRVLANQTSPSSTSGDTLRAGLFYDRGPVSGSFSVRSSSFDKRYLDYRRNNNGIIDTINTTEKIVQELERNDAVTLEWMNKLRLGRLTLETKLGRDVGENVFRASGVGTRKRHQDAARIALGLRVTRLDSVQAGFDYLWKWDDQIYRGATAPRGRQISRNRAVTFSWYHDLFPGTRLACLMKESLQQEIAEHQFNQNDRDRLERSLRVESATAWGQGNVKLVFEYRQLQDIAIRRERSSNNNIKDSYEISPSFLWPIAPWLTLNQLYSLWIQYTDYVYSDLPSVSRTDNYNKRGNVTTKVTIKPNKRLSLSVRHDYSAKFNADKSDVDATGHAFYDRQLEQRVSKINFDLSYKVTDWLTLDGTTYQSRDLKDTYGARVNTTERFSGQVGVGGSIRKTFGSNRKLEAGLRKFFSHGPNVQEAMREYWDADIQLTWGF